MTAAVLLLVVAGVALVTGYDNLTVEEYLLGCAVVFALLRRRDTP